MTIRSPGLAGWPRGVHNLSAQHVPTAGELS